MKSRLWIQPCQLVDSDSDRILFNINRNQARDELWLRHDTKMQRYRIGVLLYLYHLCINWNTPTAYRQHVFINCQWDWIWIRMRYIFTKILLAAFGAVDEPFASCMIVHFSAHISKWELVCKFGVIFHIFIITCLCSRFHVWDQWFFYSVITFSYTKCFVHSYTVDVVFTLSYKKYFIIPCVAIIVYSSS